MGFLQEVKIISCALFFLHCFIDQFFHLNERTWHLISARCDRQSQLPVMWRLLSKNLRHCCKMNVFAMTAAQPRIKEISGVIVCASCDAVLRRVDLREREVARCPRCDIELERHPGAQVARILPLTVASLIVFVIANVFPIVEMELRGMRSETTLLGAVIALAGDGRSVLALMVLMTTLLLPLLHLLLMLWLLVPLLRGYRVAGFSLLVRMMQWLRPWGMIDIFLLGVLVALIKLSSMAAVVLGPALWAFVALTVLLTMVEAFDPRRLWDMLDAAQDDDARDALDEPAAAAAPAAAAIAALDTAAGPSASATIGDGRRS